MSAVEIREVTDRAGRRAWVKFPFRHYRNHPYWVPQLLSDELSYFDPVKNPAFDVSEVRMYLALRDGETVGRVLGIINELEAEKVGHRVGRFGWFESIDDTRVAHALLDEVREWLVDEGCVEMLGPLGFTDFDPSGVLVEGHDEVPTIAGSYHYPYYADLLESYGLEKQVDYLEFRMDITEPVPILERLRDRLDDERYTIVSPSSRKEIMEQADDFWRVLEETYEHLYGVVPLTEEQTEFYTKKYLSYLDPGFVQFAYDSDGELMGLLVGMPNLSEAFRRARGRLFPFGFWHVFRAYRNPETVDLLLAAARPEDPTDFLATRGLIRMYDTLRERGVRYLETNRELETNTSVNRIWRRFDIVHRRRSRVYRLDLD